MTIADYQALFLAYLKTNKAKKAPKNLYEPIDYIMHLGGKRIRPTLALIASDLFGDNHNKTLDVALALEVFHNFTLMHDDIMDASPIRRGKTTVHKKWDTNTAILSGDVMLINAYQYLENYEGALYKKLMHLFSKTAQEVCEGQQYDVDFETQNNVQIEDYIEMIRLKTAVLLATSLKMGALVAGATEKDADTLYNFGINLGLAFQLQDDLLDALGNPETFGKRIGGDIIANKKTYLHLLTLEKANATDKALLLDLYNKETINELEKIKTVTDLYKKYAIDKAVQGLINNYSEKALANLEKIISKSTGKIVLANYVAKLKSRTV
jgi:geranylgeranyl diphosphate synthase type II